MPAQAAYRESDKPIAKERLMKQLSMTDAFLLSAESDKQKVQMASVSILAPPAKGQRRLTRTVLRDLVAERIH